MLTSVLEMTEKERERADWSAVYQSLIDAKKHMCKDGVNHTWLDGSIGIARNRSQAVIPSAPVSSKRKTLYAYPL